MATWHDPPHFDERSQAGRLEAWRLEDLIWRHRLRVHIMQLLDDHLALALLFALVTVGGALAVAASIEVPLMPMVLGITGLGGLVGPGTLLYKKIVKPDKRVDPPALDAKKDSDDN